MRLLVKKIKNIYIVALIKNILFDLRYANKQRTRFDGEKQDTNITVFEGNPTYLGKEPLV